MTKSSTYTTMQLIADILSFDHNQEQLATHFKQASIDWDTVVIMSSQHLMLPALYCKLKEKELLSHIPNDLNIYLEEIADINRGRNEILLKEIHEVSEILKREHIEHVFIKGAALLAGNTFKDSSERMIGDLDILVASQQIHTAFDIMTKHGYIAVAVFPDYQKETFRHFPRQVSPQKFGAIELHTEVLIKKHKYLSLDEQVLKNKQTINGIAVPSIEDSIKIAILALQINDRAHLLGSLKFKTIYDCLALNLASNQPLRNDLYNQKHAQSFLHISSILFKELAPKISSNYATFLKLHFIFKLHYPKLGYLIYSTLNMAKSNVERLALFTYNKSYRKHIFKNKIGIKSK